MFTRSRHNGWRLSAGLALATGLALSGAARAQHDDHGGHSDHKPAVAKAEAAKPDKDWKGDPYLLEADPVSGQKLGDKPIIHQHDGRELRFADQKSLDTFKADPAKYLARVDELMVKQQTPFYPLDACMISGDKLGGDMGKPVDVIYKNRLVRFCCKDCIKDLQKDPSKHIAKLDEAVIAKQGPGYQGKTCMVSGDKLGGDMGKPVDVVIGNQLVRLCCADCRADLNKNPLKYLKMIDDAGKKDGGSKTAAPTPKAAAPVPKKGVSADDHRGHKH